MKFSDYIVDFLLDQGINTVFSYPGEQIMDIYRELEDSPIRNILVRHEQGAAHMADGYARITNYVGVCLATAGPGATNLTTGIYTAYKDSSSTLALTGRCERKYINKNYFQEVDTGFLNIYRGYLLDRADPKILIRAFNQCLRSKKPVSLSLPRDVVNMEVELEEGEEVVEGDTLEEKIEIEDTPVKKPLILIGQGIYGTLKYRDIVKIGKILKKLKIPFATTFPARGVVEETYNYNLGLVGRRGTPTANRYLLESDRIISVGASLSYNTIPESIRENILKRITPLNIGVNSIDSIKYLVEEINETLPGVKPPERDIPVWELGDYSSKILEILKNIPEDGVVVTDAGNHTVFVSLLRVCKLARSIISSHSMGTMGFGLPASIGVKFGCIDYNIPREVISISGDGGFQMNLQELSTLEENNLKILLIVMKNNRLNGFSSIKNPDFNRIAEGYNIDNTYIEDIGDIKSHIKYYLKRNKPYLMVVECEDEKLPEPFL
ncbi:MAG TPA: thiamine pyrophosphate-binding protein [Methanothermococcus okinawensis]|uniref:Thiamine pyrophosphate-binding protein n=1 Tax=Methanothermococcus okinawensis TaxID=155863 RepID=A0A833E1P6_9EURY|nr:thiamine pyrophosphate-binding protein [Methanothermococcus okinawensis]HIP90985.1 thiamine pyrophosphate-binding protein [Methanothermococcus okinawensis]